MIRRSLGATGLVMMMATCWGPPAWAEESASGEPVIVRVQSGRQFAGHVDARSTDRQLWLRFRLGSTTLWRPVAWDRVVSVTLSNHALTKEQVLARASAAPSRPERREVVAAPREGTMADLARQTLADQPLVHAVDFFARPGNWNPQIGSDGLVVDLQTLAFDGTLAPVDGTAEITFYATRYRTPRSSARRGAREVRQLARWTRTFTAEEMAAGLRWELPFGAARPQWDRSWAPRGLVTVRVVVPGHGVFTQSHDFVRTRPASPTRDRHMRVTGTPRLPAER